MGRCSAHCAAAGSAPRGCTAPTAAPPAAPAACPGRRSNLDRVALVNALWLVDSLVEGRWLPPGGLQGCTPACCAERAALGAWAWCGPAAAACWHGTPARAACNEAACSETLLCSAPSLPPCPAAAGYEAPGTLTELLEGRQEGEEAEDPAAAAGSSGAQGGASLHIADSEEAAEAAAPAAAVPAPAQPPSQAAAAGARALAGTGGGSSVVVSETVVPGARPSGRHFAGGSVDQLPPVAEEGTAPADGGSQAQAAQAQEQQGGGGPEPMQEDAAPQGVQLPQQDGQQEVVTKEEAQEQQAAAPAAGAAAPRAGSLPAGVRFGVSCAGSLFAALPGVQLVSLLVCCRASR